jgi:hypothetical protein
MPVKNVEKLLLWLVPVSLIAFVAGSFAFALHDSPLMDSLATSIGWSKAQLGANIKLTQSMIFAASNVVAAIWLWFETRASFARAWLWALFGLVSGLWAVAIWLLTKSLAQGQARDS